MVNTKIVTLLMLMLFSVILASCEENVAPIIFQVSDGKSPEEFPATVKIDYFISNEAKQLYGDDNYIVFEWVANYRYPYIKAYPAKKTDEGFMIIGSEHKDFVLPDPKSFGYSKAFNLKKQNGQLEMTFTEKSEFTDFIRDGVYGLNEFCVYYKCYSESKK